MGFKKHEIWVDLAVEQICSGNRNGTHLSKLGWKNFIENFNNVTSRSYDRKQLKNHWDNVKKDWQLWNAFLRGKTRLGGDMERQTIDAPNEWWEAKLQGLEHAFKLDEIFHDVTATGVRAWAPSSGLVPPLFMQDSITDDNVNETANLDSEEADHEKVECINHHEKELGPKKKQFKKMSKNNSTIVKLSKQLDEIVDAIKSRSSHIRTDPLGSSVQEVLDKLTMLSGCLFAKKATREVFVAFREPEYEIEWLNLNYKVGTLYDAKNIFVKLAHYGMQ
ncbi:hypothetical protein UlMin_015820 [Ulmus minor]